MDEVVIEDVLSTLVDAGTFENSEIEDIVAKLKIPDPNFEELRLKFTLAFLAHPDMLIQHSYKAIIEKAKEFTKMYLSHGN